MRAPIDNTTAHGTWTARTNDYAHVKQIEAALAPHRPAPTDTRHAKGFIKRVPNMKKLQKEHLRREGVERENKRLIEKLKKISSRKPKDYHRSFGHYQVTPRITRNLALMRQAAQKKIKENNVYDRRRIDAILGERSTQVHSRKASFKPIRPPGVKRKVRLPGSYSNSGTRFATFNGNRAHIIKHEKKSKQKSSDTHGTRGILKIRCHLHSGRATKLH